MIKIIDFLLILFRPFIVFIGKLHWPFTRKKVKGFHYYETRDAINIGSVLLTKTNGEISNFFNPSKLKHAGLYVGRIKGDSVCYVLEATYAGVKLTDLVSFLMTKDVVFILEPKFKSKYPGDFEKELQAVALEYVGAPYDFTFSQGGKSFYCFELVANSYKRLFPYLNLEVKRMLGLKKIYDDDSFLNKDQFKLMAILGGSKKCRMHK